MTDDRFGRIVRRMRGAEQPRPEFVESLYGDLENRLLQDALPSGPVAEILTPQPEPESRRRPRPALVAVAAAIAGVLAVGAPLLLLRSSNPSDGPAATTARPPADVVAEPGRPIGIPLSGDVEGFYVLYLPAGYDGTSVVPVIIALPDESGGQSGGLGMWGADFADEVGAAIVSMAPTGPVWTVASTAAEAVRIGPGSRGTAQTFGDADVELVAAALDDVAERIVIGSVFVSGQNNGGLMAGRLACDLAERVSAVATFPNAVFFPDECGNEAVVPMMSFGPSIDTGSEEAGIAIANWADRANCDEPVETMPAQGVVTIRHDGCDAGAEFLVHLVDDPAPAGWAAPQRVFWDFFTAHGAGER